MSDTTTKTENPALAHCGYRVEEDVPGGRFAVAVETPYEGADIRAEMDPLDESGRRWSFTCAVHNNRGIGWSVCGTFESCGRYAAKGQLRHFALEMRRAYCHRGKKCRERAIARAIARKEAAHA